MSYKYIIIFIFHSLIIIKNCISIIIPIKTKIPIFNNSNIIPYYTSRKFYSNIELGNPKQNVLLLLLLKENSFYLDKIDNNSINGFNSQYIYNKSSSCKLITEFNQIYGKFYKAGAFISEDFYFLENLNQPKKLFKNISFYLSSKNEINLCFTAGIGLQKKPKDKGFIEILKDANYTNTYNWFLNYTNNIDKNNEEEIILIIGKKPHEFYPEYYSENQILPMNSYCSATYLKWGILFNKIYVNNQSFNDLLDSEINFDYASIIAPFDYWDYISTIYFNEYINLNICSIIINPDKMRYFACDKNKFNKKDINKAPIIYFYSVQFKYTFEIKGENLFDLKNDKYYFLLFSQTFTYSWILGKPFFKEYPFLYNIEDRTISFYNPNIPYDGSFNKINDKNKYNNIMIIIILSLIFILFLIFCLFLIGKSHRQRKIRSNEIEDEFVYKPHDSNINSINNLNI